MFLATFTALLLIIAFVLLCFNRKRLLVLFIADMLVSILLLADTLYFRYYYNAITISVLYQIGLVSSITESAKTLFKIGDLIFAVNIPLYIAGFSMLKKFSAGGLARINPIKRIIAVVIIICVSFGLFQYAYGKSSPGVFTYDNNNVINNLGIFYYHYSDIKTHVHEKFFSDHSLSKAEKNELDTFYSGRTAAGNKYKGIAKGKNLIIVQLEAIQQFVINADFNGQKITPNLNEFINDSTYLDNFYYQVGPGNTSDAEFLVNNSLYPLRDGAVYFKYPDNTYESLPRLLKQQGYASYAFHAYKPSFWNRTEMYKAVGFDKFVSAGDYIQDDLLGWGLSDKSFFRQSLPKIDTSKPFYSFFITLSSHHPYNSFTDYKGFDVGKYQGTMTGNYAKAANYVDQAIGELFDDLKSRGLYDDSIIIIYGDHHAVLKDQTDMLKNLIGFDFTEYNWTKLQKTPCFIRFPGMAENGVNSTICSQIDLLPTVANIMGFDAPHALGKDIFNTSRENGYAVLRNSSVITNNYSYINTDNKVYGNDGQVLDMSLYEADIRKYQKELEISDIILQKNALEHTNDN
jgi:lipoteichoic acid synthase